MMLLLVFFATLLPTHSVSAEEQVVVIPKEEVQVMTWKSFGERRGSKLPAARIGSLLVDEFLIRGDSDYPLALKNVETFKENYLREVNLLPNPSYEASMYLGLIEASKIPAFRGELPSIAGVFLLRADYLSGDKKDQIATGISLAFTSEEFNQREAEQTRRVVKQAKQDPQFAANYDKVNQERLGASITELDDVAKFIRDNPDAAIPPKIAQSVRPDGSVAISLKDLNELARTEFGKINASIDDLQTTVGAINAKQDVLLDYVKNQEARQQAQALAAAKAEEHRLKLQVDGSAINIVATLAGYIDPERGKQISVIGNAAVQIADAYTSWTKAVAGLGTLDALTSSSATASSSSTPPTAARCSTRSTARSATKRAPGGICPTSPTSWAMRTTSTAGARSTPSTR